jgi:hypothetical protein
MDVSHYGLAIYIKTYPIAELILIFNNYNIYVLNKWKIAMCFMAISFLKLPCG